MGHFKNANWDLSDNTDPKRIASWQHVQIAVLMDIRDELKALNQVFRCPRFLELPNTLKAIEKNTRKPIRRKKIT